MPLLPLHGRLQSDATSPSTDLTGRATGVARALEAMGCRAGDRVCIVGRAGDDLAVVVVGALMAGLIVVPVNPGYLEQELAHVLADSGARLVVDASGETTPLAAVASALGIAVADIDGLLTTTAATTTTTTPTIDDDTPAMLIYTSGTTGRSKGCLHTHGSLGAGLANLMNLWRIGSDDVVINALPLFHVHGLCVATLGPLACEATVQLLPRFSPTAVVDAVGNGGTVLMCVPTMIHRLIAHLDDHPDDAAILRRLRLVTCGSAPLAAAQLEAFRVRTGLTIVERYGMSESLITLSNPVDGVRVAGAVGRPVPGTEMTVVDDELWVRGPSLMRGYWGRADADAEVFVTDDAGGPRWFRTGDAVTVDEDGVVRIVGRLSQDIMKVGGFKLSTREIEDEVLTHEAVADVAVVGLPDDEWGERVCAVVVLHPGRSLDLETLQAHVQLASVKKPRALVLVPELPKNALGKVLKAEVKVLASSALASPMLAG